MPLDGWSSWLRWARWWRFLWHCGCARSASRGAPSFLWQLASDAGTRWHSGPCHWLHLPWAVQIVLAPLQSGLAVGSSQASSSGAGLGPGHSCGRGYSSLEHAESVAAAFLLPLAVQVSLGVKSLSWPGADVCDAPLRLALRVASCGNVAVRGLPCLGRRRSSGCSTASLEHAGTVDRVSYVTCRGQPKLGLGWPVGDTTASLVVNSDLREISVLARGLQIVVSSLVSCSRQVDKALSPKCGGRRRRGVVHAGPLRASAAWREAAYGGRACV